MAGPKRPQDRVELPEVQKNFHDAFPGPTKSRRRADRWLPRSDVETGAVVIAAITSCTNTSNPSVMLAAGLLAKKAVERGLHGEAVGEDQPGAGVEGGDGLLPQGRPAALSRTAQFPPGGIRLHHVHRQQRTAARAGAARGAEGEPGGGRGAQRQPQLRRPHQSAGEGQLPGLAAAGGGLRAGRDDGYRPDARSAGRRFRRHSPCTCATSGRPTKRCRPPCAASIEPEMFRSRIRPRIRRRPQLAVACRCPRAALFQWDEHSTYIKKPPYFDHMVDPDDVGAGHRRACACWRCWAIR